MRSVSRHRKTAVVWEMEHHETLGVLIESLLDLDYSVTVFCANHVYKQLAGNKKIMDSLRCTWFVQAPDTTSKLFVLSMYRYIFLKRPSFLILNTLSGGYHWSALCLPFIIRHTKVYLVVHDVNNLFCSRLSIRPRFLIRHIGKWFTKKWVSGYVFNSANCLKYLRSMQLTSKPLHYFPACTAARMSTGMAAPIAEPIKIAIPGSLDIRRRNYGQVVDYLYYWSQSNLNLEVYLLGRVLESTPLSLLNALRSFMGGPVQVHLYGLQDIPQTDFDQVMSAAHFIWIPSAITSFFEDDISETYGVSKCSGNVFDAIRYQKPILAPASMCMESNLLPATYSYSSKELLLDFLDSCMKNESIYPIFLEQIQKLSLGYTSECAVENLRTILSENK